MFRRVLCFGWDTQKVNRFNLMLFGENVYAVSPEVTTETNKSLFHYSDSVTRKLICTHISMPITDISERPFRLEEKSATTWLGKGGHFIDTRFLRNSSISCFIFLYRHASGKNKQTWFFLSKGITYNFRISFSCRD